MKTEKDILEAFEKGKLKRSKNSTQEIQIAREAAAEEGIPYQTLIASVLHKFVTGRLASHG